MFWNKFNLGASIIKWMLKNVGFLTVMPEQMEDIFFYLCVGFYKADSAMLLSTVHVLILAEKI